MSSSRRLGRATTAPRPLTPTTAATRSRLAGSSTSSGSPAKPGSASRADPRAPELREGSPGASPPWMANEAAGTAELRRGVSSQQLRRLVDRAQQDDRQALE